jgi:hypothetical protein
MRTITLADIRRHQPGPDDKPNWQESCYLGWVDLEARVCGAHHISLAPGGHRDTHVWSWVMVEGEVMRSQQHGLPLPAGDYDDLAIGSLRWRSGLDARSLALDAAFDTGKAELSFRGNCDAFELSLDVGDMVLGDRHYEVMGMVTGQVTTGDRVIDIQAGAWHDHSWGAREFSSNLSHRWLWASFGSDFSISAFGFVTNQGIIPFGWVWDAGERRRVTGTRFGAVVGDDGVTPEGCDAVIRTTGNRTYRIRGKVHDAALMGGAGWYAMDGLTEFECGGRIGEGFLEFNELKVMTAAMKAELEL